MVNTLSKESAIKTNLITASEFDAANLPDNILGIVEFTSDISILDNKISSNIPYLTVNLITFTENSYLEVWLSKHKVSYGSTNNFKFATDGVNLFGVTSINEGYNSLYNSTINLYNEIFDDIVNPLNSHIYRIWNYIPCINQYDNNQEHYKLFCNARSESFTKSHYNKYPASTGIGSFDNLNIYFLGSTSSDYTYIENPRQTPAYKYPGQTSPSFARATYIKSKGRNTMYISGTASIIGSKSVYIGNAEQQCLTTLENIEILLSDNNLSRYNIHESFNLKDLNYIKIYIRNESDYPIIKSICEEKFSPNASIAYLKADICRSELLVEIEGTI